MSFPLTLPALLSHLADRNPDDIAFIDQDRSITFAQLHRLACQTACWLEVHDIGPGDRVAVWLVNRMEWLALFFGLAYRGATLVTVNTRYKSHEVGYLLQKSNASMIVLEPGFRSIDFPAILADVDPHATASLKRLAIIGQAAGDTRNPAGPHGLPCVPFDLQALPDRQPADLSTPDTLSILFSTSGTTKGPKLVMHTQRTLCLHAHNIAASYRFPEAGSRLLATLPFCGVFGFNAMLGALAAGKPTVLMDTFDAPRAVQLIRQHEITHVFGSDEMYRRMLDCAPEPIPFPSARVFGFAAFQPGAETLGKHALARKVPLFGLYGSSEVQALFSLQRPMETASGPLPNTLCGGGFPCNPHAEIRIRDIDRGNLLGPGQPGTLEIRADSNFVGYLDDIDATRSAVLPDGFFVTGDIGTLQEDGSFVYLGRQGDAIRLGGYLVDPAEIEEAIKATPGISDAQVISITPDQTTRCVAFVILHPGATLDEPALKRALNARLARFKIPERVWALQEFPTTQSANGNKIQRGRLREMALHNLGNATS